MDASLIALFGLLAIVIWTVRSRTIARTREEEFLDAAARHTCDDEKFFNQVRQVRAVIRHLVPDRPDLVGRENQQFQEALRISGFVTLQDLEVSLQGRIQALTILGERLGWAKAWEVKQARRDARPSVTSAQISTDTAMDVAPTPLNRWRILLAQNQKLLRLVRLVDP